MTSITKSYDHINAYLIQQLNDEVKELRTKIKEMEQKMRQLEVENFYGNVKGCGR